MKFIHTLDTKPWGNVDYEGDVGIELELEGLFPHVPGSRSTWAMHNENSLRGGVEFVLRKPTAIADLPRALIQLNEYLTTEGTVYKRSIRTSTHIHVNIRHLTNRQIYNALAWYYMVEEHLVRSQGPMRIGNLFCLRMSDAEGIASELVEGIENGHCFSDLNQHSFKYGACNLATIGKFGSLEFRFLRPIVDMGIMEMWARELYQMVNVASKISIHETISHSKRLSEQAFMARIFSQKFIDYLFNACPDHNKSWMSTNLDHVYEIGAALTKCNSSKYFFSEQNDIDTDEYPFQPSQNPHPWGASPQPLHTLPSDDFPEGTLALDDDELGEWDGESEEND